jgi:hypothetical protein
MNHSSLPELHLIEDASWGLTLGERAALEGVLAQVRPRIAFELGTDIGAGLKRIAAYSEVVHAFDFVNKVDDLPENVVFHEGDIRTTLRAALAELVAVGETVQFVFVDADHSPAGVGSDLRELLESPAIRDAVILLHDVMNEGVRAGIKRSGALSHPKVRYAALNFVEIPQDKPPHREGWSGLGLLRVGGEDRPIGVPDTASAWATPVRRAAVWRLASPLRLWAATATRWARERPRLRRLGRALRDRLGAR